MQTRAHWTRGTGVLALAVMMASQPILPPALAAQAVSPPTVPVDLVICLDTSGSMTDLIDSARSRLWDIVTELSRARPSPRLRVGCLTYGTPDTSSAEMGWVVRQIDLTDDLDAVYAKLMALTTRGGDEFVGWVLDDAVRTMSWSDDPAALKLIYVAGNESANQGAEHRDFRQVAARAQVRDIIINPIFAGDREQGIREMWAEVATAGRGAYAAIDAVQGTLQIPTPYDMALAYLNNELNRTYVPYGAQGAAGLANQLAQDRNAGKLGAQCSSSRVAAKGCALYSNTAWDLVDATGQDGFDLAAIEPDHLPKYLQPMSVGQRRTYLEGMRAVRQAIRDEIQAVDGRRQAFLRAERLKRDEDRLALDDAILESLRNQAGARGFRFADAPVTPAPEAEVPAQAMGPVWGERVSLKPPVRHNVDALLAALPDLRYRVGGYDAARRDHAEMLAASSGLPLALHVGDRDFGDLAPAQRRLIELLRQEVRTLQTVQEIREARSPFPYTEPPGTGSDGAAGKVWYRVGGINFAERAIAESVAAMVEDKLARHRGSSHGSARPANAADRPAAGPAGRTTLTAHPAAHEEDLPGTIRALREDIRVLAEAAGEGYMRFVDGC